MNRKLWFTSAIFALALAVACSRQAGNPASPSSALPAGADAAADGTTLKASAPVAQSPVNNFRVPQGETVTLVIQNSTLQFASGTILQYRFEVFNAAGTRVYTSPLVTSGSGATTSHTLNNVTLDADATYSWWARAELSLTMGPWSPRTNATFVAPANTGYIRGNEMYDPLINGRSVGEIHGPVQFIPGKGAKLLSQGAYISYQLESTLFEGEFSLIVESLAKNTEGGKTKLFAMGKGYDDIVTNEYRMTVEKRGDPPGTVAWRFIARDDQVDTEGAEREVVDFDENQTYFWQATWRNNFFNLLINEGGVFGHDIYEKGKHWEGRGYEPSPHVLYLGAPVGRSGLDGASVDGVIIRQVWVSGRPRPGFANQ
jgi:hypothetical protein